MSSISSLPAIVPTLLDPAENRAVAAARSADAPESGAAAAGSVPDPVSPAAEILSRLGLAGLRSPSGTGDISVLLAQTLFGTEEARGDAEKQRAALKGSTALGLSGLYNTEALQADLTEQQALRKSLGDELTTATGTRNGLRTQSATLAGQVSGKEGEVATARKTLADAKTPEEKTAAQTALTARENELQTLQTQKAGVDRQLATAEAAVTRIEGEIKGVDQEIAKIDGQISVLVQTRQIVAAMLSVTEAARERTVEFHSRAIDIGVEDLFAEIAELANKALRDANPLLRADRPDETEASPEAPPPPPPRPVAVAAALQAALADLLRELNGFDPLLLARPPEQTGLDRLRLRV
jgi:hypothetical protein